MKKIRVIFFKKALACSLLLRIVLAHIAASYLTIPLYMLVSFLAYGETHCEFTDLLLAPYSAPILIVYNGLQVMLRFPFFDLYPNLRLSPYFTLWLSYGVFLIGFLWAVSVWAGRPKSQISAAEQAEPGLSPAELAMRQKRFRWKVRVSVLVILIVLVAVRVVRWWTASIPVPDIKLLYIPAGEFVMGCGPTKDSPIDRGESPPHKVRISKGFYMGATEVTQAQWKTVMGYNFSYYSNCDDLPVTNVNWYDAVEFCKKLSRATGKTYRLPTEAEWEYACRAGTQTHFYFGNDPNLLGEYAWYDRNSRGTPHPVGQKKPNAFGLYDMLGNVEEWCSDRWEDTYYARSPTVDPQNTPTGVYRVFRVVRGGSYSGDWENRWKGSDARYWCATRSACSPDSFSASSGHRGFRIIVEAEDVK